jgi:hypothetical protein
MKELLWYVGGGEWYEPDRRETFSWRVSDSSVASTSIGVSLLTCILIAVGSAGGDPNRVSSAGALVSDIRGKPGERVTARNYKSTGRLPVVSPRKHVLPRGRLISRTKFIIIPSNMFGDAASDAFSDVGRN